MGGPQSPLHIDKWPYLQDEIHLIKKSIEANKAILGICLGAQLIAESLGAKTERSPHREIGVFPIELLPDAERDPLFSQFPAIFPVMHWHNDMPGIPKGARLLAKSAGCPRQVFSVGDRIYGLQCHMEMTEANIKDMLQHCEKELSTDLYVETKQQLLSHHLNDINKKMLVVLNYLSTKVN
jgi:GMP synthase (glutamine-hydrolysing)